MNRDDAAKIYSLLLERYPDAIDSPSLSGRGTPFEVLILTILSAQTTDRAVLAVKKPLFSKYPEPLALSRAKVRDVENIIRSLGFFHAKARNIIAAAKMVTEKFGGNVPGTMEELLTLPGVGRKTANIVLFHGIGRNEGIAVDTHVRRLAQRIGFSDTGNVAVIERDLMSLYPREIWGGLTDVFIAHGRATCTAKKPQCPVCPINALCRYYRTIRT
jgi:endonuclease-3